MDSNKQAPVIWKIHLDGTAYFPMIQGELGITECEFSFLIFYIIGTEKVIDDLKETVGETWFTLQDWEVSDNYHWFLW